jgi:hypothetical protein
MEGDHTDRQMEIWVLYCFILSRKGYGLNGRECFFRRRRQLRWLFFVARFDAFFKTRFLFCLFLTMIHSLHSFCLFICYLFVLYVIVIAVVVTFFFLAPVVKPLDMASYDLNFGKKNSYVPASAGDGGQGTFGAVSPNDWRVPGTSPIGQSSYPGAPDGGDEPWFAEAISTVSLDLKKAEDTLMAFTKEAAELKVEAFCASMKMKDNAGAMKTLVGAMGYGPFLEASPKQLEAAYKKATGVVEEKKAEKSE